MSGRLSWTNVPQNSSPLPQHLLRYLSPTKHILVHHCFHLRLPLCLLRLPLCLLCLLLCLLRLLLCLLCLCLPYQSLRQLPEVIIVLDSDEEDEAVVKKQRMDQEVKQEDEVKIKMERSDSYMDMLPQQRERHVHQPLVDTVFHTSSEDDSPNWPQDYYVCDVAKAFKDPPRGVSKKAAFQAYFPEIIFKKSTYYDNYNLWIRTPTNLCTKHANYGRTPKGLWRGFLDARAQYLN